MSSIPKKVIYYHCTGQISFCHHQCHAQASVVIRSHRPLGLRWGPFTCPQRWHRRPAGGVETTSGSSSSNMATYCRERPQTTESGLWSAQHRAYDRERWHEIVETAMLQQGHATWWWWWPSVSGGEVKLRPTYKQWSYCAHVTGFNSAQQWRRIVTDGLTTDVVNFTWHVK